MFDKERVLYWNEIEYDLYEENGHIFGVELDLFNNHKSYYHKTIEGNTERLLFFKGDIYMAIEQFNAIVNQGGSGNE